MKSYPTPYFPGRRYIAPAAFRYIAWVDGINVLTRKHVVVQYKQRRMLTVSL